MYKSEVKHQYGIRHSQCDGDKDDFEEVSAGMFHFPVMFSLFILSMYAVIGVVLLFIIKFALSVMEENSRK